MRELKSVIFLISLIFMAFLSYGQTKEIIIKIQGNNTGFSEANYYYGNRSRKIRTGYLSQDTKLKVGAIEIPFKAGVIDGISPVEIILPKGSNINRDDSEFITWITPSLDIHLQGKIIAKQGEKVHFGELLGNAQEILKKKKKLSVTR